MNRPSEAPIDENSTAIAHPASAPSPSDTPPNHANPASSDDAPDDAVEGVDVATLLGPANVPAPLHEPMPKDEDGRPDWMHLQALVVAVEVLISAGMTSEARPSAGQPEARDVEPNFKPDRVSTKVAPRDADTRALDAALSSATTRSPPVPTSRAMDERGNARAPVR